MWSFLYSNWGCYMPRRRSRSCGRTNCMAPVGGRHPRHPHWTRRMRSARLAWSATAPLRFTLLLRLLMLMRLPNAPHAATLTAWCSRPCRRCGAQKHCPTLLQGCHGRVDVERGADGPVVHRCCAQNGGMGPPFTRHIRALGQAPCSLVLRLGRLMDDADYPQPLMCAPEHLPPSVAMRRSHWTPTPATAALGGAFSGRRVSSAGGAELPVGALGASCRAALCGGRVEPC